MKFPEYLQTVLARRAPLPTTFAHMQHAACGLITEVGELMDPLKRYFAFNKPIDAVNVMEEIGDLIWYIMLYADAAGIHVNQLERGYEAATAAIESGTDKQFDLDDYTLLTAMTYMVVAAAMAAKTEADRAKLGTDELAELLTGLLCACFVMLKRYGYTMAECLTRNDAKLAKRIAEKRAQVEGRDLAAERKALEGNAT
jgi:NTP pyrophosphatase (non-canonical NTP hydrolase)